MDTLTKLGFDLANEKSIRLDLDDRPQKSPRACVIASDAPNVVHLITRAQGGLHDYQAFLHEAGHALHYAGCDPELPYTFRNLSRDHALTEIYSFILEAISREPGWHAEYFDLSDAEAATNAAGDDVPRSAALPALCGEAPLRARVLGALHRGWGNTRRLRGASGRGDRGPLPALTDTSRTWTRASTRPTTYGRGSAPPSSASTWHARSAKTGGARPRRATVCARSSAKGRSRRAKRSPPASASIRSTRSRSSQSSPK